MTNVLVTGGAGYIGAHVCKALARAGHTPIAYDNLGRGERDRVRWGPLIVGDVCDVTRLTAALKEHAVTAVMHLAALAFIDEAIADPELYRQNNIEGTRTLLAAMAAAGVNRIVASSSCTVYADGESILTETSPVAPTEPYGASKVAMEALLAESGVAWAALRYFNAAGADPEGEIGENNRAGKRLIPNLLDAAMGSRQVFAINGTDYPTGDGTCVRDFVHVSDIAAAHLAAMDYLAAGGDLHVFNLGNGAGFSIRQVIEAVRRVTGAPILTQEGPRRPGDAAARVANADLAERVLGWAPRWPALTDMIAHAWAWRRSLG